MKKFIVLACAAMISSSVLASDASKQITETVKTPFKDLNLTREDIPAILESAKNAPYALAVNNDCFTLKEEIDALTSVLGPDLDASVEEKSNYEKAGNAAFKALNKTVEGAIPYRSWIRKLTGAEKHAKKVDAAVRAGNARRSFLKGVSKNSCPSESVPPAIEEQLEKSPEAIEAEKALEANWCERC